MNLDIYLRQGIKFRQVPKEGEYLVLDSSKVEEELSFSRTNEVTNIEINCFIGFDFSNLEFLSQHTFIRGLSLVIHDNLDISGIHHLSNLEVLSINIAINQTIDLEKFPKLKICNIGWNKKIKFLEKSVSLRELTLDFYKSDSLVSFKSLKNLRKLRLIHSSLKELKGINHLRIEELGLFYLKKLTTLDGIEHASSLKKLDIENCNNIRNLEPLKQLPNLVFLSIYNCKDINSLKPIGKLSQLEIVYITGNTNVLDGDMNPLIGKKDATFGVRKHYSHTNQEIDRLNGTVREKNTWDY